MRKITKTFILILIGLVGVPGCSQDIHVFKSTADKPITVAVVDPVRDVTVWEMDIPVAHKVKIDLDRQPEFEPIYADLRPPRFLSWRVYHEKGGNPIESDRIKLPGTPVLLQVSYRPSGELPPPPAMHPPEEAVSPIEPHPLPDRSPDATSQLPDTATSGPATSEPATSEPAMSEPATSEAVAAETVAETEEATTDAAPEASDANPEGNEGEDAAVPLPGLE